MCKNSLVNSNFKISIPSILPKSGHPYMDNIFLRKQVTVAVCNIAVLYKSVTRTASRPTKSLIRADPGFNNRMLDPLAQLPQNNCTYFFRILAETVFEKEILGSSEDQVSLPPPRLRPPLLHVAFLWKNTSMGTCAAQLYCGSKHRGSPLLQAFCFQVTASLLTRSPPRVFSPETLMALM